MISPFTSSSSYVGWGLQLSICMICVVSWFCALLLLLLYSILIASQCINPKQLFLLASTQLEFVLIFVFLASNLTTDLTWWAFFFCPVKYEFGCIWTWVSQAKATQGPELSLVYWVFPYKCIKQCQNRIWFVGIFLQVHMTFAPRESILIERLSCLVASCSGWSGHWLHGSIET